MSNRRLLLIWALLLAGIVCLAQRPTKAYWQSRDSHYNVAISSGGANPFTLDGTPQLGNSGVGSVTLPGFTTTLSPDVVFVGLITNTSGGATSVSGCGLTWNRVPGLTPVSSGATFSDLWYAIAATTLSGCVATANTTAFTTAAIAAFSGAHTAAPFDVNVALPGTATSTTQAACTTSNANDILIAVGEQTTPGFSGSWVAIFDSNNFFGMGYLSVSSTQSATPIGFSPVNSSICDAIIKGP